MKQDRPLALGLALFLVIILTVLATSIQPINKPNRDFAELKTETQQAGTGDRAVKSGDKVKMHYTGTLKDGTEFDTSRDGDPLEFTVGTGEVIKGWDQGLIGMKLGEKRRLEIPASLAYGSQAREKIPANSGLIFEVELMGFVE